MKKTLISLATASLIASSAMAADKGIDFTTTGQAVVYYETQTENASGASMFGQDASQANVGVQLNLGADLGNSFTFGSQFSYIGTAGLEKNLVSGVRQVGGNSPILPGTTDELALTKIFVAKTVGNTTVKIGRQELPKSLSPFAYTEGWNVFKNTFDAILVVNSDLPDTTLVGAFVSASNATFPGSPTGLSKMNNLSAGGYAIEDGAYMLTAQNKSLPMTTLTASLYQMNSIRVGGVVADNDASAVWIDAQITDKSLPMGLNIGLQGGSIMLDLASAPTANDTTAFGVKVGAKPVDALAVSLAFTSVDDGTVGIKNVGTGIKSPLYTQMVYNQNAISTDADSIVVKGAYSLGDMGTVTAQYCMTTDNSAAENDYNELDVLYKVKSAGVQYFAGLMMISTDKAGKIIGADAGADSETKLRVWARYAF